MKLNKEREREKKNPEMFEHNVPIDSRYFSTIGQDLQCQKGNKRVARALLLSLGPNLDDLLIESPLLL